MNYDEQLHALWRGIDDVAIELAQARDSFIALRGEEKKAQRLTRAYSHLRDVEDALYEYIKKERRSAGEIGDRLAFMMSNVAVEHAKFLTDWANDDLSRA